MTDFKDIFVSIADKMRADFEASRSAFNHPSLKGSAAENILIEFLRIYLPDHLSVISGIVVDSNGGVTKQQDIIICDKAKTPVFFTNGDIRVVPIEAVYATIEVKSNLRKQDISSIVNNMLSVKRLIKKAYYSDDQVLKRNYTIYDMEWDYYPVNYFFFAFKSDNSDTLRNELLKQQNDLGLPLHQRVDCGCVLDSCVYLNAVINDPSDPQNISALPYPNAKFATYNTQNALLLFYTLIANVLFQATCRPIRFNDYLGNMTL